MFIVYSGVQSVLSREHHTIGKCPISVSSYHPVLDELERQKEPPPPPKPVFEWKPVELSFTKEKKPFFEHCLSSYLREQLQSAHAEASIHRQTLVVHPLPEASELHNWDEHVREILDSCSANFSTAEQKLSKEAIGKVWEKLHAYGNEHPDFYFAPDKENILVAGSGETVNAVLRLIDDITETEVVMTKTLKLPLKHVKYLLKFCKRQIEAIDPPVCIVEDSAKLSPLVVTGVQRSLNQLENLISEKVGSAQEDALLLSAAAYKLLSSKRGVGKLEETIGTCSGSVVYTLEKAEGGSGDGLFTVLSHNVALCKAVTDNVKTLIFEKQVPLAPEKRKICMASYKEWRTFVERHTNDHFLSIRSDGEVVVIVGEAISVPDVVNKVKSFIAEQTAITDTFELPRAQWQVIRDHLQHKLTAIQKDCQDVEWTLPKSGADHATSVSIRLRGDPKTIQDIQGRLELLTNEVYTKDVTLQPKPGLKQAVDKMGLKRHELQQKYKAVIETEFRMLPHSQSDTCRPDSVKTQVLVRATTPVGVRVKVVSGDFTRQQTDVLVNFVSEVPNFQAPVMAALIEAGGDELRQDLASEGKLHLATAHVCSHGKLPCSVLLHLVVPTYTIGSRFENVLCEALDQIRRFTTNHRRIHIVPLTASPFNSPVQLYAEKVLQALEDLSEDTDVSIFVEDNTCKDLFEEKMRSYDYHIIPSQPDSRATASMTASFATSVLPSRDLAHSLKEAVKIKKGNMLDVQVGYLANKTHGYRTHISLLHIFLYFIFRLMFTLTPLILNWS